MSSSPTTTQRAASRRGSTSTRNGSPAGPTVAGSLPSTGKRRTPRASPHVRLRRVAVAVQCVLSGALRRRLVAREEPANLFQRCVVSAARLPTPLERRCHDTTSCWAFRGSGSADRGLRRGARTCPARESPCWPPASRLGRSSESECRAWYASRASRTASTSTPAYSAICAAVGGAPVAALSSSSSRLTSSVRLLQLAHRPAGVAEVA
jgi:hypothetical protein